MASLTIHSSNGFHLIEILIVLTIIGILSSFIISSYSQHFVHTKRLEAANKLLNLAISMEKYHIQHNSYEGATLVTLNIPELIVKDTYQLIIKTASNDDYLLIAKPLGQQAENDKLCAALTLTENGERNITGIGKNEECWE